MIKILGKRTEIYVLFQILKEISFYKINPQTKKVVITFPDITKPEVKFFSDYLSYKYKSQGFHNFISIILNIIQIDQRLNSNDKFMISDSIYEYLNVTINSDNQGQSIISIGFLISGIPHFESIGKKYLFGILNNYLHKNFHLNNDTLEIISNFIVSLNLDEKETEYKNIIKEVIRKIKNNNWSISESIEVNNSLFTDMPKFTEPQPIEFEDLVKDLGPTYFNLGLNNSLSSKMTLLDSNARATIDFKLNEKRIAEILICSIKQIGQIESRDTRIILKLFLKAFNNSNIIGINIDETTEKKISVSTDFPQFYKSYSHIISSLNSSEIFKNLDHPDFQITDKKLLESFIQILNSLGLPFMLFDLVFKRVWKNIENQINTITFLISNSLDFMKKDLKNNNIKKRNSANYDTTHIKTSPLNSYLFEVWNNLDILSTLIKIGGTEFIYKILPLFEWPKANIPELLILGLSQIEDDNMTNYYIYKDIFHFLFENTHNSLIVFEDLFAQNFKFFINMSKILAETSPDYVNYNKIWDLCQRMKETYTSFICSEDDEFSISIAIVAIKRDYLNIEQWLNERIEKKGESFVCSLLKFIVKNVINEYNKKEKHEKFDYFLQQENNPYEEKAITNNNINMMKDSILEKSQLTIESLAFICGFLYNNSSKMNREIQNEIKLINNNMYKIFDNLRKRTDTDEEVENKANNYFKQLFSGSISISNLIIEIKKMRDSTNKNDNEIFSCIIFSILEEFRFFPKYPDNELKLMASLCGEVINSEIISGKIENIFLFTILEGFKNEFNRMFKFSCIALEQMVSKIERLPKFLEEINRITVSYQGELFETIRKKFKEYMKNNESLINSNQLLGASSINYNLNNNPNNINMNQLKNKFMNFGLAPNTSNTKYQTKNNKFNISNSDSNSFPKDINFNQSFNNQNLNTNMMNNIKGSFNNEEMILQNSEKTQLNPNQQPFNPNIKKEKEPLKLNNESFIDSIACVKAIYMDADNNNEKVEKKIIGLISLAEKIGSYTLKVNKPLKTLDINLKALIINSVENNKLIYSISFVAKLLESSIHSVIFHPKNPFIFTLLSILSEVYDITDDSNVKKIIENLFNKLSMNLSEQPRKNILYKNKVEGSEDNIDNLNEFKNDQTDVDNNKINSQNENKEPTLNVFEMTKSDLIALFKSHNLFDEFENICKIVLLQINKKRNEPLSQEELDLNDICADALLSSINDLLSFVLDRSISISLITGRELIVKDLCFESNHEKFNLSIMLAVKALASSLSKTIIKDPLKQKLSYIINDYFISKYDVNFDILKYENAFTKLNKIGLNVIKDFILQTAEARVNEDQIIKEEIRKRKTGKFEVIVEENKKKILANQNFVDPCTNTNSSMINEYILNVYENYKSIIEN